MQYYVKVLFKNEQNVVEITSSLKELVVFCCRLVLNLEKFKYKAEFSVLFTNNEKIKVLNFKYREKDAVTDVLSFPTKGFGGFFKIFDVVVLGDIVISVEKALTQYKEYDCGCFEEEIARLTIHSVLHLLGYDHELDENNAKIMFRKERVLNKIVSNKFGFGRSF